MSRVQLYNEAKILWISSGRNVKDITRLYKSSSKYFWIKMLEDLRTEVKEEKNQREEKNPLTEKKKQIKTKSILYREANRLIRQLGDDEHIPWIGTKVTDLLEKLTVLRNKKKERDSEQEFRESEEKALSFLTSSVKFKNGDGNIIYTHDIPRKVTYCFRQRYVPDESTLEDIVSFAERFVMIHAPEIEDKDAKCNITVEFTDIKTDETLYMTTEFQSGIALSISLLRNKIQKWLGQYNEQPEMCISKVIFRIFVTNPEAMGYAPRSEIVASNTWLIISPQSRTNCLFQALSICRGYRKHPILLSDEGQNLRVEHGRALKRKVNPTDIIYSDNNTIREASEYLKTTIKLYDNTFRLVDTIIPTKMKSNSIYEIQRSNGHCIALIRRKDILNIYKDFIFPEKDHTETKKILECKIIKPRYCNDKYNDRVAAWDIETFNNKDGIHVPYAVSIAWYKDNNMVEQQFWGLDCLERFTVWLYNNKSLISGYTLYAHNGGKYDIPLAIQKAFMNSKHFIIEGKSCIELNNAWIGLTLRARDDKNFKIYFRDSFRMLPMKLKDLCIELKVKYQKLDETIEHSSINESNYMRIPEIKTYLTHDVFGLLEAITKFSSEIYKDMKIDLTKCYTGASLSKRNFFQNYYYSKMFPVYTLSEDIDLFIRKSYYGGRVECFQLGNIGKCYYYDYTSLYPDVGRLPLPYGKPTEINFNESFEVPKAFFGFVECMVKTKDKSALPIHSTIKDSRLIFPIFENWTKLHIFSAEINYDVYDYKFLKGYSFQKAPFMKKFFQEGFIRKAENSKKGNSALANAYKIIINSGYGFWGLRSKNRDGIVIYESNDNGYHQYLNSDKLLNILECDDYYICRVLKNLDTKDFNVAIASAISSYARIKLHGLITDIRSKGHQVYYCDTDSIITNLNLNDYKDLKVKHQWDNKGEALGTLKNEADKMIAKKISKDAYDELLAKNNYNFYFDEGIITGCKQYALRKHFINKGKGDYIETVKLKGYSQSGNKLSFSDMAHVNDSTLNKTALLSQNQKQFRCPKTNYVSETTSFEIRTTHVKKKFRRYYSKGIVIGDQVTPIIM